MLIISRMTSCFLTNSREAMRQTVVGDNNNKEKTKKGKLLCAKKHQKKKKKKMLYPNYNEGQCESFQYSAWTWDRQFSAVVFTNTKASLGNIFMGWEILNA